MDSKLQIISGEHRGRKLYLPDGARPTQNMAREAVFNILTHILSGRSDNLNFWDAFAGSGIIGLEFLSRRPNSNVFYTDISAKSIETITKNLRLVHENAVIDKKDAIEAISDYGKIADVIFVDPPYDKFETGKAFVQKVVNSIKPGTILIWEIEKKQKMPKIGENWTVYCDRTYGRARFLFLIRK